MIKLERRWSDFCGTKSCACLDMNGSAALLHKEEQNNKLKEFRKVLQDILEPHHDDQFLLRWLKARDFDIVKAERMIRESFKFRKKIGADKVLTSEYKLPEVYKKYPFTASLGFDKHNSVVRIVMAGICDFKGYVSSMKTLDILKVLVYELESDLKMIQERKKKLGKLEEKTTFVLDLEGFSLKQFYDKAVINAGITLITMYQDNYPETLRAAYLINVPSYFSWIFNIFKPFLNAVTLSKIKVYRSEEWREELLNNVDPAILPGFLGGELCDPDEKCSNLINWNSKIDPSHYLKQQQNQQQSAKSRGSCIDPDMKSAQVPQRGVLQVPVQVSAKGSVLRWAFATKDYNLKFGLLLQEKGGKTELLPVESVDCQLETEENEWTCEKAGTYILHFDNSYSWLTAKQLYYKVNIEVPTGFIETNNN